MKKGYHIPLFWQEKEIRSMGEILLGMGYYEAVEIKYPFHLHDFDPSSYVAGIRGLVEDFRPEVTMHIPTNLDIGHVNTLIRSEIIDEIKRAIEFAAQLKATVLPIHPGTIGMMDIPSEGSSVEKRHLIETSEIRKSKARSLTVEALMELSDLIATYSPMMKLAVENVLLPSEVVYTASQLDGILQAVGRPNVGALFDSGHAYRNGIRPDDFVRALLSDIIHVHINDNDGTCDLHLSIGKGMIDFRSLFKALKEKGYCGIIVVETSFQRFEELIEDSRKIDLFWNS
ncbi:sugar phosphate isomerase/epimerase family protein [Thermicanus aegyptius]|uniref:sugar phosphate isomerase/epimerase family protein n=1 Tax=Thermicanus aegyptius TaxID=94009 RepID=UPI00069454B7|nr:sugar phosphate isomerase/epimerase family protein [Thermicanus aegyptius]